MKISILVPSEKNGFLGMQVRSFRSLFNYTRGSHEGIHWMDIMGGPNERFRFTFNSDNIIQLKKRKPRDAMV